MSNQNLVPRENNTGSIGVPGKRWGTGVFQKVSTDEIETSVVKSGNANLTGSLSGSFTGSAIGSFGGNFNGDFVGDGSQLTGVVAVATGSVIGIQRIFGNGFQVQEFTTISGALAESVPGDTVFVGAGVYEESELVIPVGVQLTGKTGTSRDVIIKGSGVEDFVVKVQDDTELAHFEIEGGNNENPIIVLEGADTAGVHPYLFDVSIRAGNNPNQPGVYVTGSGFVFMDGVSFITTGDELGDSVLFDSADDLTLFMSNIRYSAKARSLLKTTGSAGFVEINGLAVEGNIVDYTYGFDIDSDVSLQMIGANWSNDVSSSVYFNNNSDGCEIQVFSANVEGELNDILIAPSASGVGTRASFTGTSFRTERYTDQSLGVFSTNAEIDGLFIDRGITEEPKVAVLGNLSVGTPNFPSVASFGEGQSQTNNLICFSSGSGGFVDNTVTALSPAQPFDVFPNDSGSGATFYVGNAQRRFAGLRTTVTKPQIDGRETGVWEYSSGSEWVPFNVMHTDGEFPYQQWGQQVWPTASVATIQNTRFDSLLVEDENIDPPIEWTTTTVNGSEAYWIRYRLETDLDQSAEVNTLALHTNRARFGKDGFYEQFGQGQVKRELTWHRNLEYSIAGQDPSNSTIDISPTVSYRYIDNTLRNNQSDGNGGIIKIPAGLDTSRPLDVRINFIPDDNADDPVRVAEIDLFVTQVQIGDILDGTLPSTQYTRTVEITNNDALRVKQLQFNIDVPDIRPGEFFSLAYRRDATNGNPADTYTGNLSIVAVSIDGYFWN